VQPQLHLSRALSQGLGPGPQLGPSLPGSIRPVPARPQLLPARPWFCSVSAPVICSDRLHDVLEPLLPNRGQHAMAGVARPGSSVPALGIELPRVHGELPSPSLTSAAPPAPASRPPPPVARGTPGPCTSAPTRLLRGSSPGHRARCSPLQRR